MLVTRDEWWRGDRLKGRIFCRIRQLIMDEKDMAFLEAPRRKTDITFEVAEAVIGAAAVAIGWREDPAEWKIAADELRHIADVMERTGLRDMSWGPNPTVDPTPVTFRAAYRNDDGYVGLTFPELPEADLGAGPDEDCGRLAQAAVEEAVLNRLYDGEDVPRSPAAITGEVDVTVSPDVGGKLLAFWAYGRRPKRPTA